ncbi:GNAT family N-acetyltransferase [Pyxidicoccus sp. 3LG]
MVSLQVQESLSEPDDDGVVYVHLEIGDQLEHGYLDGALGSRAALEEVVSDDDVELPSTTALTCAFLEIVFVGPRQRGQKRGTALLDRFVAIARQQGMEEIVLKVSYDYQDDDLVGWYRRFGFNVVPGDEEESEPRMMLRL